MALLATALGITPLKALLSDSTWLFEAWLTMILVITPAAILRTRRAPSALDVWPGIILLVPWLTRIFVPHHAFLSLIPTHGTLSDISDLMTSLHHTTRDEVAPIHSTLAVRLVVCALIGLLAALVDLVAVVGRRGALAGVPLLVVYTVAGAVPRTPVAWGWFAVAAVGFLILLGLDANDDLREWGRRIARHGSGSGSPGLAFSAPRIGIIAVIAAVLLPSLVPADSKNFVADIFHSSGGGVGGFGAGSGGTGAISPFVALKGQLDRDKPIDLLSVHVDGDKNPWYMRSNILDKYTGDGWTASGHGETEPLDQTTYSSTPPTGGAPSTHFRATLVNHKLSGNAPVFSLPDNVAGLPEGATWSPQDQILQGTGLRPDQRYVEDVSQPEPTVGDLRATPPADSQEMARWLDLPKLPKYVTDLVARITRNAPTPYDRARDISDYFANPENGFIYSLKTKPGDSGSALVDFLRNGVGFCQQYAAAMGVMLRQAGVPSRVVLGYMHPPVNKQGNFTITTNDAHAWVEAYFPTIGWIPFDPTPPAGLAGDKKSDLSWAPHTYPKSQTALPQQSSSSAAQASRRPDGGTSSSAPQDAAPSDSVAASHLSGWVAAGVLVLLLLGLVPAGVRAQRRRRRFAAGRQGDSDALWAELSDTATDLGYVWSRARTPRQVSRWLARDAGDAAPELDALAAAVEQRRYAPTGAPQDVDRLTRALRAVQRQLRGQRDRRMRLRATLWPASLGWTPRRRRK
jgi:transglutaminase-like putative cysteine protease